MQYCNAILTCEFGLFIFFFLVCIKLKLLGNVMVPKSSFTSRVGGETSALAERQTNELHFKRGAVSPGQA